MKKIILLLLLMCITLTGSAQRWVKHHESADELKGTSAVNLHYADISNIGSVIILDDKDLLTFSLRKGIFDYKRYEEYYVVDGIAGMYGENGDLVEKVNIRINVSEDSPDFAQAYFNSDFGYEGSGAIKKILSWIRNNKGSIRFIIPKYGGTDFDVKLPTLLSQKQAESKAKPKGTALERTKSAVKK
jgi:hypothetical protein